MYKVKFSPFVQKQNKIHHTQIKQAAQKIKKKLIDRKNRDYYESIKMNGNYMYLTYQWQDEDDMTVIYVKNAKWIKKKRKR